MGKRATKTAHPNDPTMRSEYDFRGGVRGKYADRTTAGDTLVVLDPDVAKRFPTSKAVNDALRALPQRRPTSEED
jgi:hypothetical protein